MEIRDYRRVMPVDPAQKAKNDYRQQNQNNSNQNKNQNNSNNQNKDSFQQILQNKIDIKI